MTGITLYAITDTLPALLDTIDMVEPGTEERAEIEAQISAYLEALPQKVDAVAHVLATYERMQDACDAEIKRIQDLKRTAASREESLREYIKAAMLNLPEPKKGPRKLAGATNELTLKRTAGSVVVEDEDAVPDSYFDVTVKMPEDKWNRMLMLLEPIDEEAEFAPVGLNISRSIRKADISKDLKAGAVIPGCDLAFGWSVTRK
jgi:hypothetical protein